MYNKYLSSSDNKNASIQPKLTHMNQFYPYNQSFYHSNNNYPPVAMQMNANPMMNTYQNNYQYPNNILPFHHPSMSSHIPPPNIPPPNIPPPNIPSPNIPPPSFHSMQQPPIHLMQQSAPIIHSMQPLLHPIQTPPIHPNMAHQIPPLHQHYHSGYTPKNH